MNINNPWVGYVSRGYEQIKLSVINALKVKAPEIKDYSETNLLIILVSIFAGIAEMLNYYIDQMAREAFISTTRIYSNMVKHTRLLDYRVKPSLPASVNLTITALKDDDPVPTTSDYYIKAGHIFKSDNNVEYLVREDILWPQGVSALTVPVEQLSLVSNANLGTVDGTANQGILIPEDYAHNTMVITILGGIWTRVDTLGRSNPTDQHFIVDVNTQKLPYIQFGDGIFGKIPTTGAPIIGTYYTTKGAAGVVGPSAITSTVTALTLPGSDDVSVNNIEASSGGYGIQTLEQIRRSLPLSLRTLDRAVTRQDYVDIAKLAPGVNKAALHFECGKTVDIYISPLGGGIAQQPLLDSTHNYIYERKMVTTKVNIFPAGESLIYMEANITAKFRKDKTITNQAVTEAILDRYSIDNSDINKPVRRSDIIATIDNVEEVDYLELNKLAIIPFPRPKNHSNLLDWDVEIVNPQVTTTWILEYTLSGFRLYKNNSYRSLIGIGVWYEDPDKQLNFKINFSSYTVGDRWTFSTYPVDVDQVIDDYSMPLANVQNIRLKVTEQITPN